MGHYKVMCRKLCAEQYSAMAITLLLPGSRVFDKCTVTYHINSTGRIWTQASTVKKGNVIPAASIGLSKNINGGCSYSRRADP